MLTYFFKIMIFRDQGVADTPRKNGRGSPFNRISLALFIVSLLVNAGCKVAQKGHGSVVPPSARSTEQLIVNHLAKLYEQPTGNLWEEGKTYFLPGDPGIELLQDIQPGTGLSRLRVYEAAVWSVHWGPEKFPVFVWAVGSESQPQLGVLAGPDKVASAFPTALRGLIFERPEARESLALLIGKMVSVFYGEESTGRLQVASQENCEWAELPGARRDTRRRVAASCFSEEGVLEKIVLPERGDG